MKISVVVPCRNEKNAVLFVLESLSQQTLKPDEVIVVDSGSTDTTLQILKKAQEISWGFNLKILFFPSGYPGFARNRGVAAAKSDMVAFLDCGLTCEKNWLSELATTMQQNPCQGVQGYCEFFSTENDLSFAICALSSGVKRRLPVLPSSLFERKMLLENPFREDIRAAEDLHWLREIKSKFKIIECPTALVHYHHFPESVSGAVNKWFTYSFHTAKARVNLKQSLMITLFFVFVLLIAFWEFQVAVSLLLVWMLARSVWDAGRKSETFFWWNKRNMALIHAFYLALFLDGAKAAGFLYHFFQGALPEAQSSSK